MYIFFNFFSFSGCDTGFGHLLARRLDSMGYKVFAGCLYSNSEHTKKLIDTTSNNLQVVQIDVTQDDSVKNALKVVEKNLGENGKKSLDVLYRFYSCLG